MNKDCIRALAILATTTVALSCALVITGRSHAQGSGLRKLVGEWELSAKSDPGNKRSVTFMVRDGQLTGIYKSEGDQKLTITDISLENGKYAFRVSDANLVFRDFRFVGSKLEGVRYLTVQEKGKSVPQVVQMIRKLAR